MVTLGREEIRELLVESLERLERRISGEQLGRMRVQLEVEGIPGDFREGGGAFSGAGKANKTLLQKGIFRYGCN